MFEVNLLKDASEIVRYQLPQLSLFIEERRLSDYINMKALCHWHEDIEYIRALDGRIAYEINGQKITVHEGDAVIVNARQMHYGFSDDRTDCRFMCILFNPKLLSVHTEILEKYFLPVTSHPKLPYIYLQASNPDHMHIIEQFERIFNDFQCQKDRFELLIISRLLKAWQGLFTLLSPMLTPYPAAADEHIAVQKNMLLFIYKHYASSLTLQDIAKSGGVCRSKCCLIFKKYMRRTPIEFLNTYRLEASIRLLSETSMTVTEIALACGFQSPSYYTETFRHYKGCTPSAYRRQQKA